MRLTTVEVSTEGYVSDDEVTRWSRVWGWFLAAGIAAVLLGFVVLAWRTQTLYALSYFAGAAFLFLGCLRLADAFFVPARRIVSVIGGVVLLAIGIIIFVWPNITLFVLALLVALGFVVWGVLQLVSAFADMGAPHWWVSLIGGLASLVIGVWAVRHPGSALNALMILLGVWIMLWGAVEIAGALLMRHGEQLLRPGKR